MGPKFRTPAYRPVRLAMYSLLGLSAFIPVAHGMFDHGWQIQNQRQALSYFIGLAIFNFSGAAIYAIRIPERWYPTTFDILGASHQMMHVLVMCGALCYSIGLEKAFDYWHQKELRTGAACSKT